jgi:hypothetical protein
MNPIEEIETCPKCGAEQRKDERSFGCWSCGGAMKPKDTKQAPMSILAAMFAAVIMGLTVGAVYHFWGVGSALSAMTAVITLNQISYD